MALCRHGSLAARLCHQRVYATDNHTGDNITYTDRDAFGREVMAARGAGKAALDAREVQLAELQQQSDLLPLYRYINQPAHLQVLSVVGVSHKPWFDPWLAQLQGIEVVAAGDLLK